MNSKKELLWTAQKFVLISAFSTPAALLGAGAPDLACTVHVAPGHSIQHAIDGAATGDILCVDAGTYHENLVIAKDGITLKGEGPEKTILVPPAKPAQVCLKIDIEPIGYENFGVNGICSRNTSDCGIMYSGNRWPR